VGSNREEPARFRLVAASNEPMDQLIEAGRFRRDLFHRLQVLHFRLPALVERRGDIPLLAQEFLARYASAHGRSVRRLSPAALEWLSAQTWPGNVRQLENFIERTVIFVAEGATELGVSDMHSGLSQTPGASNADTVHFSEPRWTLAEMERRYVQAVLRHTGGNKTRAAQFLDIDYKTLLRKQHADTDD
jgi:two-component system response regulator HydG